MPETLLTLLPEAAGHELLGGLSGFFSGTASSAGGTTTLICDELTDPSGAQTYRNWWAYCHTSGGSPTLAGQERLVTTVDLSTGTLTVNRAYGRATATTEQFWLLNTLRRGDWLRIANRSLRQMKRRVWVSTVGLGSSILRYSGASLPSSIVRPEDVIDVGYRSYPEVTTEGKPTPLRWFGWEDNDGALTLLLSEGIGTSQELCFYIEKPFAAAGESPLVADSTTTTAPADWLIGEMVEHALRERWARAAEGDKPPWKERLVAQIVTNRGLRAKYLPAAGRRHMGFDPTF